MSRIHYYKRGNLKKCKRLIFVTLITLGFSIGFLPNAYSATQLVEDWYLHTMITYPEGVVRGSDFNISLLTENTGSGDRFNATTRIMLPEKIFSSNDALEEFYGRVAGGSSYGRTVTVHSLSNSTLGEHFINIDLFHIYDGSERFSSVTLPITIREEPKLVISTSVQESIYSDAEFPFIVNIESQDSNLRNVTIKIIPPEIVTFRGQTQHTFSSLDKDTPVSLRSELITASDQKVDYEHYIPFQIIVDYTDDTDTERSVSETVSVLLRPKAFFEFGAEGGFWLGSFYFTPTISFGALFGVLVGLIGFYRWHKTREKNKGKK